MTDPLDTAEAILDQHPADWREWTAEDVGANMRALEMIAGEMEAAEADRFRDRARWQRILALNEQAQRAGRRTA